jgi:hypothetical protein
MSDPIQNNWRYCRKCYSLFYYGFDTDGVCPAGDQHEAAGSANYYLVYDREDQV